MTGATVLDLIGLVDKSWLWVEPDGRYALHELVRQYCAEKLGSEHELEAGESTDQVRDRHCAYFTSLADSRSSVFGPARNLNLMALAPELANLRAAWLHTVAARDLESGYRLGVFWGIHASLLGHRAPLQLLDPVINKQNSLWETGHDSDRQPKLALVMACLNWTRAWQCLPLDHFAQAFACAEAGLAFLERAERCELWQGAHFWLSVVRARATMHLRGPEAAERMQRELAAYLAHPDGCRWLSRPGVTLPWWRGWVSVERGFPLTQLGRYAEAEDAYEQASALWAAGTGRSPWSATVWLPVILCLQGKYVQARQYALQSLNALRTGASRGRGGEPLAFLAEIEAATGEIALAREHYRRSLAIARTLDRHGLVCFCLEGAGRLELDIGRPAKAVELYHESLAFADRAGIAIDSHVVVALVGLGRAALAMGERGQAERHLRHALRCPLYYMHDRIEAIATLAQVFAAEGDVLRAIELLAFAVAHPATAHRVRQPLARLLAELEAELPAEQFAAAAARGRARELDEVVAQLIGEPANQARDEAAALI